MFQHLKSVNICHSLDFFRIRVANDVFTYFFFLSGLSGFFPLHPMTITEAERRRTLAEQTQTSTAAEGVEEGQRQTEV